MRLSVLYFSPVPRKVGGAETVLLEMLSNPYVQPHLAVPAEGELADWARARNIPVHVISLGRVADIRRPFNPYVIPFVLVDALRAAWALRIIARSHEISIVHSNGLKAHGVAALASLLGAPAPVVHLHDIPFTGPERLFWRILRRLARHVVVVSRPCWPGDELPANVSVVPNGIQSPPKVVHPSPRRGQALRVGFVGRVVPAKSLPSLLEDIRVARDQGRDVTLTVRGPAEPEYARTLAAQIDDLGLTSHVRMEGPASGADAIYANIDVLAVPSRVPDPLPRVILEALSRGLPVVAYPSGGIPDMIEHARTGFLAQSAEAFSGALAELQSPVRWRAIASAAHQYVLSNRALENFYGALAAIYGLDATALSPRREAA